MSTPPEPPPAHTATAVQPVFSARVVARTVLVVVAVVIALYLVYLLRQPIGWVLIATFLAIALSGPVNALNRRMRRGFAILIVYLGLLLVPIGIAALIVPPLVTQTNKLVTHLPTYVADVRNFVEGNKQLAKLERDYDITGKLQQQASKLPAKVGDAASLLSGLGLGVVNSLFKLLTILVLTAFLLGSGRRWVNAALQLQPSEHRERVARVLDNAAAAVGNYVGGALAQATLAGVTAFVVLAILGIPFAAALGVVMFVADLIPLVGATIGAVLIGIVTLFGHFPAGTIAWTLYSIVYQQIENNFIQPQIQRRAVDVHPFVVLVAVLFGATLIGVMGALVAIPVAASVQIAIREWWAWRRESARAAIAAPRTVEVPPGVEPPPEPSAGG